MVKIPRRLRDNGLSIVLFVLFVVFLAGQAVAGWLHGNEERRAEGFPEVAFVSYLGSGAFGEAVFENWESEFLQMGLYVILTVFLFQRGSSESKDPDKKEAVDEDPQRHQERPGVPLPVKRGGILLTLYNHSLSLALLTLFTLSFVGHAYWGNRAVNEEAFLNGEPPVTVWTYLTGPQFWFESFQNWQSEFLAIYAIVVLSIWLREKGSPESKPVAAGHSETGG